MARKILVVDDDPCTLHVLVSALRRNGYDTVTAQDGTQAVMRAHREHPDAILLDITMPGGDGCSVLKKLGGSAHTSHIPVIVITSSDDPDTEAKVPRGQTHSLIYKPFDLDRVLAHLAEALEPASA